MITCEQVQQWIEYSLDERASFPAEIETHLSECQGCREYKITLESAIGLLDELVIPSPPPMMVNDVMAFIAMREESRAWFYFPGMAIMQSLWRTCKKYNPNIRIPAVLQQEAWPTAIATFVILFGSLLPSLQQPEENQKLLNNPVVMEVNSVTARIRNTSDNFIQQVEGFRKVWFGLDSDGFSGSASPFGRDMIQKLE